MGLRATRPEDVIPGGSEFAVFAGRRIRMGTVAAFVANVQALRDCAPGSAQHSAVWAAIVKSAPHLAAVGVFDVLRPKDAAVADLVDSIEREERSATHAR